MLIATKDGQVIEVGYRYSRDPENDARREMNSRKRRQGGDGEQPQITKKKHVAPGNFLSSLL